MARRVDEVEFVGVALMLVVNGDGPGLHGDASVPLDIEIVEDLLLELTLGDRPPS